MPLCVTRQYVEALVADGICGSGTSDLAPTVQATLAAAHVVAAASVLTVTDTATGSSVYQAAADTLTIGQQAICTHVTGRRGDCQDSLDLQDMATATVGRSLVAQSAVALAQAERIARPWYLAAESPLQTVTEGYDQAADTFYPIYEGLQDSAGAARPLTVAAHQSIPLAQSASAVRVKPTAIDVSAQSALELRGEVRPSPTGAAGDWLTLGQTAAVDKCKLVRSLLDLTQEAAVLLSVPRGAASTLALTQAAAYSIVSRGVLQQYKPFVGEGASGSPTPPAPTIGPPEHVALPFQLFSPAEGVVTDSMTLRAPNLGNKDRLSFNRILRETRGGTLVVFADPIWPKIETLVLTFSGLRSAQTQRLLVFLEVHLGEEIGLVDWEGRAWKGVVMSPTDPVVQDGRDSFSASFEFEGELIPA